MIDPSVPLRMAETHPQRWRPSLTFLCRGGAFSAMAGAAIGAFFELGGGRWRWSEIAWSALVGLLIFGFSILLLVPTLGRLAGVGRGARALALSALFLVSGCAASLAASVIAATVATRTFPPPITWSELPFPLVLNAFLGLLVGSGFYLYEDLRERVRESVSRLKESEFAAKELELARSLQSRLLPPRTLAGEGYRAAARNLPAGYVAGDFYDVFTLSAGGLGLVVADVSGKGIGASLIMASAKAVVPLLAAERDTAATLAALNERLAAELERREFVALCHARLQPTDGRLELANAGLPDPYLLRRGAPPRPLSVPGPRLPLGLRRGQDYAVERLVLEPGDRVLFLTDGLPEALTASGEPLGYERLTALFPAGDLEPTAWLDELFARLARDTAAERQDDWTALLLERL